MVVQAKKSIIIAWYKYNKNNNYYYEGKNLFLCSPSIRVIIPRMSFDPPETEEAEIGIHHN